MPVGEKYVGYSIFPLTILFGLQCFWQTIVLMEFFCTTLSGKYYKDSLEFQPERWLRENKDENHPFSNLPFGFGTRMCLGKWIGYFRVPKTLTFKMRLGAEPFPWKEMSFICMRMKNYFHIKGRAPALVLKQRPGATRKWPIMLHNWRHFSHISEFFQIWSTVADYYELYVGF